MGFLGRTLGETEQHVAKARQCLADWLPDGALPNVVAHSFGCEIATELLRDTSVRFDKLHLIAGAVSRSFAANGLNEAVLRGQVREIYVWYSPADEALREAKTFWLAGYGWLGLEGPDLATMIPEAKAVTYSDRYDGFGHTTYFEGAGEGSRFDFTMRKVTT